MARKRNSENDRVVSSGAAGAVPSRRKSVRRGNRFASPAEEPQATAGNPETAAQSAAAGYEPTREEIEQLAYSYWEARGCQGGCPEDDWTRAEQELRARTAAAIA